MATRHWWPDVIGMDGRMFRNTQPSINCHRPDERRAFFENFASVPFQAGTVLVCQANWGLPSQFGRGCVTQLRRKLWVAAVIESN
ncbi:hypothetical protein [Puniceibacterium confluentis]|uniref:hypothetical protein n=1 Tax=Puniceibacterium confluentis TaxID=1958944 RepID=UPI0011B4E242|nr:hypothetical protein [Puniceibacterium confluentis]